MTVGQALLRAQSRATEQSQTARSGSLRPSCRPSRPAARQRTAHTGHMRGVVGATLPGRHRRSRRRATPAGGGSGATAGAPTTAPTPSPRPTCASCRVSGDAVTTADRPCTGRRRTGPPKPHPAGRAAVGRSSGNGRESSDRFASVDNHPTPQAQIVTYHSNHSTNYIHSFESSASWRPCPRGWMRSSMAHAPHPQAPPELLATLRLHPARCGPGSSPRRCPPAPPCSRRTRPVRAFLVIRGECGPPKPRNWPGAGTGPGGQGEMCLVSSASLFRPPALAVASAGHRPHHAGPALARRLDTALADAGFRAMCWACLPSAWPI